MAEVTVMADVSCMAGVMESSLQFIVRPLFHTDAIFPVFTAMKMGCDAV